MKNYVIITIVALGFGFFGNAQTKQSFFLSSLLTSQKGYINTQIQEKERSKYQSCIHFADVLLPRVYEEIQKLDSSFWNNSNQTNILEYFPSYGNLKGVIWKSNGTYYSFFLDEGKKLNVQEQSLENLEVKFQSIIRNFSNWSNTVFSNSGQALGSPTDHPFYMAGKLSTDSASSIGFYY